MKGYLAQLRVGCGPVCVLIVGVTWGVKLNA